MRKPSVKSLLVQLFRSVPDALPKDFSAAAARLLHARHLIAYDWAMPYILDKDVLEIGVNRGYGSKLLKPEASSFVGVDLDYDLALKAHQDQGLSVVQANGQKLPFSDEKFDVVVTFQVIEHVWNVSDYLHEIARVLRPGGVLLVSTPQIKSRLYMGQMPWNDEHLREYGEDTWHVALTEVFAQVTSTGLFAKDLANRTERRRTYQDAWQHFLGGSWMGPIRRLGRTLCAMRQDHLHVTSEDIRELSSATDDDLLDSYYFDRESMDDAHDLFAVCQKQDEKGTVQDTFNATEYWRERIREQPTLQGTGTGGAPLVWQNWLYKGKQRAYMRTLKQAGFQMSGKNVLNFGCGIGYFESFWEQHGALQTGGIDVATETIEKLSADFPKRCYLAEDLTSEQADLSIFKQPDLITAIDVLYHIVDDEALLRILKKLCAELPHNGFLMLTDALRENIPPVAHVRFRSLNQWQQILDILGFEIVVREPVFIVNNRLAGWCKKYPSIAGAMQHYVDLPLLRTVPWLANNWVILARRRP
ncbi:MAG: methyltransferase domain-containing protein [Mariprofundaceae bacterium]|nr:methyltransferase domain-containing protein [Mariprofundaceae bacterium]